MILNLIENLQQLSKIYFKNRQSDMLLGKGSKVNR
jgi:hypothetical protein